MDKIEELAQLRENLVDDIEARHINRLNIALENLEKDVVHKLLKLHKSVSEVWLDKSTVVSFQTCDMFS